MDRPEQTYLRHLQNAQSPPATSSIHNTSRTNSIITWILVICVALPFIIASFLQCIFVFKQRTKRRQEQALEEVNRNPGGRALILEMLFRENVKEVQEGELEGKKTKRVLVKKRRKKTEEERRRNEKEVEEGEKRSKWLWWGEEKVRRGSTASEDQQIVVVCISSDGLETDMDNIIGAVSTKAYCGETKIDGAHRCIEGQDEECGVNCDVEEKSSLETSTVVTHEGIADKEREEESFASFSDDENTEVVNEHIASCFGKEHIVEAEENQADQAVMREDLSTQEIVVNRDVDDVGTPKAANRKENDSQNCLQKKLQTPELDTEDFGKMTVALAPRIRSQPAEEGPSDQAQVLMPPFDSRNNGPGDVSPMSPCFENGEDTWIRRTDNTQSRSSFGLVLPELPDIQHNDDDYHNAATQQAVSSPPCIFRNRSSKVDLDEIDLQQSLSNGTEIASNVDSSHSKGDHLCENVMEGIASAEIVPSYKLKSVESYKTDGSSISYFSYEDVSIEDEDSEMCAVCLCPYEEGDIRVFSKHCSHVFHKECIFEWLVKGHNECPCCRTDMVTKSEIKATSASLIGTERLNQAMQSATVEAPPFRARRGPRLPRHMAVIARREAWREWRVSNQIQSNNTSMSPRSPNAHWLWSARHQLPNSGSNSTAAAPPSASSVTSPMNNNSHNPNTDWLWTMRFENMARQSNSPSQLRTARSSDAIDSNNISSTDRISGLHQSALTSRSFDALQGQVETSQATSDQIPLHHHATAGSLVIGRNLHPHWNNNNYQSNAPPRRAQYLGLVDSPMSHRLHPHWQQHTFRRDMDHPSMEILYRSPNVHTSPSHTRHGQDES